MKLVKKQNLVLIGFMGCGKTTIGRKLAMVINYQFIDTDQMIEEKAGMEIPRIFEQYGEVYFRKLEAEVVQKVSGMERVVIATGGGVIKNPENIHTLKENGVVLYLKTSAEKIFINTINDQSRPLLMGENRMEIIQNLLAEREPLYIANCDYWIELKKQRPWKSVESIIKLLRRKGVLDEKS